MTVVVVLLKKNWCRLALSGKMLAKCGTKMGTFFFPPAAHPRMGPFIVKLRYVLSKTAP